MTLSKQMSVAPAVTYVVGKVTGGGFASHTQSIEAEVVLTYKPSEKITMTLAPIYYQGLDFNLRSTGVRAGLSIQF